MKFRKKLSVLLSLCLLTGQMTVGATAEYFDTQPTDGDAIEFEYEQPTLPDGALAEFYEGETMPEGMFLGSYDDNYRYYFTRGLSSTELADMEREITYITSRIDPAWSDLEKALFVNDELTSTRCYDLTYSKYDAYNNFVEKTSVCQGYSEAYWLIMNRLGIECRVINSNKLNHAWNQIKLNGKWYHIDVTWNDPIPDTPGRSVHKYFLLSDKAIREKKHDADDWMLWYEGKASPAGDAYDTTYDNYFWLNIDTTFRGTPYFCIRDDAIVEQHLDGSYTNVISLSPYRWYVNGSSGSFWVGKFSGVSTFNNRIYFNTPTEVKACRFDGTGLMTVHALTEAEAAWGKIYNSYLIGSELYYCIADGPGSKNSGGFVINSLDLSVFTGLEISEETFPDEVFRQYVTDNFDLDKNGLLTDYEISKVTEITVIGSEEAGKYVTSLEGINVFTDLTSLNCANNRLTELDLDGLRKLKELDCSGNSLKAIDTGACPKLIRLECADNGIIGLNTDKNSELEYLDCSGNELTYISTDNNPSLKYINCTDNSINMLRTAAPLEELHCGKNPLILFFTEDSPELKKLDCSSSKGQSLAIDVSRNAKLEELDLTDSVISGSLDLSRNKKLTKLSVDKSVPIYGSEGSYAETYAKENGNEFQIKEINISVSGGISCSNGSTGISAKISSGDSVFTAFIVNGRYEFENVPDGEYVITFTKSKCCPRDCSVIITGGEMSELDVELRLYGDADNDGEISIKDALQIVNYRNSKASSFDTVSGSDADYLYALADINGDGVVNITDALQIVNYRNGKASGFDKLA